MGCWWIVPRWGFFRGLLIAPFAPRSYPILAMWRSPGDGSDDGKGQHTWKISPVDATVEDQVQQDERSVLVSDIAGTNFAIQVVAGTPTIRGHWSECDRAITSLLGWIVTSLSCAGRRRTWATSGTPRSRYSTFVGLGKFFWTMKRARTTWKLSGVMKLVGSRWKVAIVMWSWWSGLGGMLGMAFIGYLHGGSQTFFEGHFHLIDHLFWVEGRWRRWWTRWRHRRWFRLALWCRWCGMDWWRRDRGRLWSLLMRNQRLKVIDMGHGLVVKLLIQQRVFLLKCLDLCLSLSLTLLVTGITTTKLGMRDESLMWCRRWHRPGGVPHRIRIVGPTTRKHGGGSKSGKMDNQWTTVSNMMHPQVMQKPW